MNIATSTAPLEGQTRTEQVKIPSSVSPCRIGFVLVPNFSLIAYSAAIEALRLANYVSNKMLYRTVTLSADGAPVMSSGGVSVVVDERLRDANRLDMAFVCSGIDVARHADTETIRNLRRLGSHGAVLGAMCTASHILAKAGLLDGYRCTVHWENLGSLTENFPNIDVIPGLYTVDRNRYTCAGGTASMDMMLHVIAEHAGLAVAAAASDQMIHHRIREGGEGQRMALRTRLDVAHPKLLSVIAEMEENLEQPVNCGEMASRVGLSTRQLERLFRKYMDQAPTRYYLGLRLERARYLLLQTSMPILDVALACGFVSASHFSKCYREFHHRTPSEERRQSV